MRAFPAVTAPAVSIVMGVHNDADGLRETIESARVQTMQDLELIVVDDGSTDPRVHKILNVCAACDSRVSVFRQANAGLTRALIAGCSAARGRYIARLDAGDVMLPDKLAAQIALLETHPEAVLATCWTEFCGPCWEPLYTARNRPDRSGEDETWVADYRPDDDPRARCTRPTSHPSVLMRADAYRKVGGYRSEFYYGQDGDLWCRLAEIGPFAGVQRVLYRCRIFPHGISMRSARRQRQLQEYARQAFLARTQGRDERPFLEAASRVRPRRRGNALRVGVRRPAGGYYFIGEALRRRGDRRCRLYFKEGLKRNPLHVKLWFRWLQDLTMAGK